MSSGAAVGLSACDSVSDSQSTQSLAVFLSVIFSLYLIIDSVIIALVVWRKAEEAERIGVTSLGSVGST